MTLQIIRRTMLIVMTALSAGSVAASAKPQSEPHTMSLGTTSSSASALLENLPLDFVANHGQWDEAVRFAARKRDMAAAFGDRDITLRLGKAATPSLALKFESASSHVRLIGEDVRAGHYNFAIGNDRSKWRWNVPSYAAIRYREIYPGIDVRVREAEGQLEYDLLLEPGSELGQVVMRAEGASRIEIAADGALLVRTADGTLRQSPPRTWEERPNGERRLVVSRFRIVDGQRYGFEAPGRDTSLAMVVDPGLAWSTFLGGSSREFVAGLAAAGDGSGDLIVAGSTTSADFPTSPPLPSGGNTMFVARLTANGSALAYLTFIGGTAGSNIVFGLVSDGSGSANLAGVTDGVDFPTTLGAHRRTPAGAGDGFVTKLNATGSFAFSTLLGGTGPDRIRGIAVDTVGNVIVGGWTKSTDFPTTAGAYDRTFNTPPSGDQTSFAEDAFLTKLSADGSQLLYSTFFGGQSYEEVTALTVDGQGFVTVVGSVLQSAQGQNIPLTADAFDRTFNGHDDIFVARFKFDGMGSADLKYSTLVGGDNRDMAEAVAFDPADPELVTIAGWSFVNSLQPPRYPTTSGALKTVLTPFPPASQLFPHNRTGVVTRFRLPAGGPGTLVWSTYFGGNFDDYIGGMAVDSTGAVVVTGGTRSQDYPTTRGALDRTYSGEYIGAPFVAQPDECFVARISSDGSTLLYSTFLGGSATECFLDVFKPVRIVTLGNNTVAVASSTTSPDFPSTPGAFQPTYTPGPPQFAPAEDGFVAKLTLDADNSGDLTVATPVLTSPANGATFPTTGDITLRWNTVSDASGIEAYVYQISSDPNFGRNFIQYTGSVSTPEFLARSLSIGTHYWRVQAADRAGNLGAFSPAFSFRTGVSGASPVLAAIRLDPPRVNGGLGSNGTVFLNFGAVAPTGGSTVTLRSDDPALVNVPATVTIPAGANSAPFTLTTSTVAATTSVSIIGELGLTQNSPLTLEPPSVVLLRSLSVSPTSITAGAGATGTVVLSNPAPAGGAIVALSSNNSAASVPFNVTVPAGATSATFSVTTSAVSAPTNVNISAGFETGLFVTIVVNPATSGGVTLSSLSVNPASVVGGTPAQGTVTLSGPAPSGGAVVSLSSSNTNAATVPSSVTVPAGSTSANFTVATRSITSSTTVAISATRAGVTRTASLAVTPQLVAPTLVSPSNGATLAQPVILDWNDVAGAASYVVQVDDSNNFSTPLVVNQTVTTSQFTAGTLQNRQHWWRVRAVSSAGTNGPWSSVRSFTPQSAAPGPPALSALSANPSTVAGGNASQGTVTLTAPAPSGGFAITLASSNTAAATVPGSVTVAQGASNAIFPVTTATVSTSTPVTITASAGGVARTATLTVTPPAKVVTLTVSATGRSGERVLSNPSGINVAVGSTGSASFASGTSIRLSVTNERDAIWSGACSSGGNKTKTCTFTPTGNAAVAASVQ